MAQRHSTPIRGLMSTNRSPQFQGQFGRMFRSLPKASFGRSDDENVQNLTLLGFQVPQTQSGMSALFDPPTDGPDPEESGIPALYTYLGQFIDHDITFDPASSLQAQDDPDALTDFRTPAFDLDNTTCVSMGPNLARSRSTFSKLPSRVTNSLAGWPLIFFEE
jgi:hypothetical protein